jgi:NADH-quinone oxidoreductase subunit A
MEQEYLGVLLLFIVAVGAIGGMMFATSILGPKRVFADKMEPFECGESPIVSPRQRFSVKFYLVAVLFLLFDVEVVFLYPWAAIFRKLGMFGYIEMLIFILILGVGLLYVWKKGALEWE